MLLRDVGLQQILLPVASGSLAWACVHTCIANAARHPQQPWGAAISNMSNGSSSNYTALSDGQILSSDCGCKTDELHRRPFWGIALVLLPMATTSINAAPRLSMPVRLELLLEQLLRPKARASEHKQIMHGKAQGCRDICNEIPYPAHECICLVLQSIPAVVSFWTPPFSTAAGGQLPWRHDAARAACRLSLRGGDFPNIGSGWHPT